MGRKKIVSPCGTESAYKQHLWYKETPCEPCKAAHAERMREYYAAKPERRPHRANPVKARASVARYQQKHRERLRDYSRQREMERRHGLDVREVFAVMWAAQGGLCYLCGNPMTAPEAESSPGKKPHIDHDHRCCPPGKSCACCRRGIACDACNVLISRCDDDPARLRKIADNLERALSAVDARLAAKPRQIDLTEELLISEL